MECRWEKSVTPPRRAKPYIPEPILRFKPIKCWSWRRDLNPRPSDYKSDALPTELRQQSETTGPRGRIYPSDPFQMSGTILKGTITVIRAQPFLLRRTDHMEGSATKFLICIAGGARSKERIRPALGTRPAPLLSC